MSFAKAVVAALAALAVSVISAVSDHAITQEEWVAISTAWAGVVAVWAVPNKPAA